MNRFMRGMSNGGFAAGNGLTEDQLLARVPSLFAETAHESRSARFAPIPTIQVLRGLQAEGFSPFMAQQSRTRIADKENFTKHMIRMRHASITNDAGTAFEIILVNANDGTSSYQMIPGYFRFVCANGLMVGDTFDEVKVRHTGNPIHDVIEGAYTVLKTAPEVTEQVDRFKALPVTNSHVRALAEAAHSLRFPEAYRKEDRVDAPISIEDFTRPRRSADAVMNLWAQMNIVQENMIRGGQRFVRKDANGQQRRGRVREVTGIDQTKALNRALWTLTERMSELMSA